MKLAVVSVVLTLCVFLVPYSPVQGSITWTQDSSGPTLLSARYHEDNILLTQTNEFVIVNRGGIELWDYSLNFASEALPISNDNILVITSRDDVFEITPQKQVIWESQLSAIPYSLRWLPSGNFLVAGQYFAEEHNRSQPNGSTITWEYQTSVQHQYSDLYKVGSGNYLITDRTNHTVFETGTGWSFGVDGISGNDSTHLSTPLSALQMSDGNILVADFDNYRVIVVNKTQGLVDTYRFNVRPKDLDYDELNNRVLITSNSKIIDFSLDYASPSNLTVTDNLNDDGSYLRLEWDFEEPSLDFQHFWVHRDAEFIVNTTGTQHIFNDEDTLQHTYTVSAVYSTHDEPFNSSIQAASVDEPPLNPIFTSGLVSNDTIFVDVQASPSPDVVQYNVYISSTDFTNTSGMTPQQTIGSPSNISFSEPPGLFYVAVTVQDGLQENNTVETQSIYIEGPEDEPLALPSVVVVDVPEDAGGEVVVYWEPVPSQYLVNYEIYYRDQTFSDISSWVPDFNFSAGTNQTTVDGLTNNQSYYFVVVPVNTKGLKLTQVNPVEGIALDNRDFVPPDRVVITNLGSNSSTHIYLDWTPSSATDFDRYQVFLEENNNSLISTLTPEDTFNQIGTTNTTIVDVFQNRTYFVAVAVLDDSDNYLEPIWNAVVPHFISNGGNGGDGGSDGNNSDGGDGDDGSSDTTFNAYDFLPEIVGSFVATLLGILIVVVRRQKMKGLLTELDGYYNKHFYCPEVGIDELVEMKHRLDKQLHSGKLNEAQYLILEKRIDEYVRILSSTYSLDETSYAVGDDVTNPFMDSYY
jgi:hypothetical protein